MKKILFVGGGTGGHLFPAIALANELLAQKKTSQEGILFVCAQNNSDSEILKKNGFFYKELSVAKFRRYFSWENIRDFFRFFSNIFESLKILSQFQPDLIFSKGGFVSLPLGIAAKIKKIPFYLHETDAEMGLANIWLSKIAKKIFTGFPTQYSTFLYLGNPVRKEFFDIQKKQGKKRPLLFVMGGSQGSQFLNEWTIKNAKEITKIADICLVAGENQYGIPKNFSQNGLAIYPFLHQEYIHFLHSSDVVLARAGGSLSEFAAAQKCTILVPLPSAANNHQLRNAQIFAKKEAALLWEEKDFQKQSFDYLSQLLDLLKSNDKRAKYEKNIAAFAKPDAVKKIIEEILKE